MNKRDIQANLFEMQEMIDLANRYEDDLNVTIDLIIKIYEKSDDLNNTLLKEKLNHLKKVWKEREQVNELRSRLNKIY